MALDDKEIDVDIHFSHHVFTDEKVSGAAFNYRGEKRWFCIHRYSDSKELPNLISKALTKKNTYAVPYLNQKNNECYYHLDITDYALFLEIRKPQNTTDQLKIQVVSAYDVNSWGRNGLPKGKAQFFRYILAMRLKGKTLLKK